MAHFWEIARSLVMAIKKAYQPPGCTVMQNGGDFNDTGHYHVHIFPRYHGWSYEERACVCTRRIAVGIRGNVE